MTGGAQNVHVIDGPRSWHNRALNTLLRLMLRSPLRYDADIVALRRRYEEIDARHFQVESWVTRWLRRHFPVTDRFHESHFVVELNGKTFMTPLAVALVLVETTDLIFAVDSIPAIFAITADPFLVFTSNVFAILCLRSLYFGLAGLIQKFRYLKVSLSLVLAIVGVKMLAATWIKAWLGENTNFWLLGLIFVVLLGGGVASWIADKRRAAAA